MGDSGAELQYDDLHPAVRRMISRRAFLRRTLVGAAGVAVFGGALTLAGCGGDDAAAPAEPAPPPAAPPAASSATLYERLGGGEAIDAVVGRFLELVGGDERINGFFANVDLARLRTLLGEQIGQASGGPETYSGRDMKTAHAGLGITVEHFNALVEDLVAALGELDVPQAEQDELLALLGPMQPDIVTA